MLAALELGLVTAAVASVDHRRKDARSNHLEEDEWYCAHIRLRCADVGSARVEERWQTRERIYLGVAGPAGIVFVMAASALWRGRDRGARPVA